MKDSRCLILGASGVLGSRLFERLGARVVAGTYCKRPVPGGVPLDITDPAAVAGTIRAFRPDVILHAAGLTRPGLCEVSPKLAWSTNVDPLIPILESAKRAKVVLFSTDYVFDGLKGDYTELDEPKPINVYGQSKLAAEQLLLGEDSTALVVRVAGLFGWSRTNREFIRGLTGSTVLECSIEHRSSYTYIDDIVSLLPLLLSYVGVVHLTGPGSFTRVEFMRLACRRLGLQTEVLGVPGSRVYQDARRPVDSSMRSVRVQYSLTPAEQALEQLRTRLHESNPDRLGCWEPTSERQS